MSQPPASSMRWASKSALWTWQSSSSSPWRARNPLSESASSLALRIAEIRDEQIAVLQVAEQTRAPAHRRQRLARQQRLQPRLQPRDDRLQQRSTPQREAPSRRSAPPLREALQKDFQQVRLAVLRAEVSVVAVESTSQPHGVPTSRTAPGPCPSGSCTTDSEGRSSRGFARSPARRRRPRGAPHGPERSAAGPERCRSSDTRGPRSVAFCSAGQTEKRVERSTKRSRRSRCSGLRGFPRRPSRRSAIKATLRRLKSLR